MSELDWSVESLNVQGVQTCSTNHGVSAEYTNAIAFSPLVVTIKVSQQYCLK